ncbi:MAG: beta-galactosidase trimerization domain-containing protein [Victivallales bacterium]|nr:beta-galactosidase trimerization domain-containing protein [Victivallales bacterium]
MKRASILLLVALLSTGIAAEVRQAGDRIALSNSRMSVEISLAQGGRVSRLTDLRAKCELTEINAQPGGSGLFGDTLFNPANRKVLADFRNQRYRLVSVREKPVARVTLETIEGNPVTIRKTYVLEDTSDTLKAEYELTNPGDAALTGMLRNNFGFRFPDEKQYTVQFPEGKRGTSWQEPVVAAGTNRLNYEPGSGKACDLFFYRVQRDYVAVMGRHAGVVVDAPFPVLDFFYTYQSAKADGMAITDWFTTPFSLPPLSKGKAEAELLSVMDDPLAKYRYRFTVGVTLVSPQGFVYEEYRAPSTEEKRSDFLPVSRLDAMHADFNTPALVINPNPMRRLRILAIAPAHGNHELGELNRRLNHSMDVLDTSNTTRFAATPYFGWSMPEPEKMLPALLRKNPEIILVCGQQEKALPKAELDEIVSLVERGTAFIYVSENNGFPSLVPENGGVELPPEVYSGILRERLPVFANVLEFRRGKGRVIHVRFPMLPHRTEWVRESRAVVPYVSPATEDFPYWEYYFAFYGKLFRHLASLTPEARIVGAAVADGQIRLELESLKALAEASIQLTADLPDGSRVDCGKVWQGPLGQGKQPMALPLPEKVAGMDGEHRLHFLLENQKATQDWFAVAFHRQTDRGLESLCLDRTVFEAEDAVTGTLTIRGGGQLSMRLRENVSGRTVALLEKAVASGEERFTLRRCVPSEERVYRLEAELLQNGERTAFLRRRVFMRPDWRRADIRPLVWGPHFASWRDLLFCRELADCGFDLYLAPMFFSKDNSEAVAESLKVQETGMEYVPLGVEHVKASPSGGSLVRSPCLRDPSYLERVADKTALVVEKMKEMQAERCLVSDEMTLGTYFNSPHDYCMSPWCLAAFRKRLREKYRGDLTALNRNWGSSFAGWDAVTPLTFAQSGKTGNFASFIEHRTFMFTNMTDLFQMIAAKVQAGAGATTGVSGMQMTKVYQGFDLCESMSYMKSSAYYHTPFTLDALRSFSTPAHLVGSFTDYGVRYGVWEQLIGGLRMPSVWWYGHLMRRGDARLSQEGEHLRRLFRSIRDSGAGHVLANGSRLVSGVALLWSTPSMVAAAASVYPSPVNEARYKDSLDSWSQLLRDMGLDSPEVVTPAGLSKVTPERYPVLILPLALLLSDSESVSLKNYVRAGGLLIADYAPGLRDQFGVPRQKNPLSELFGVALTSVERPCSGSLQVNGRTVNGLIPGGQVTITASANPLASLQSEVKGVRMKGILLKPSSQTIAPAAILRDFRPAGNGRTLYLNFLVSEYFPAVGGGKHGTGMGKEDVCRSIVQAVRQLFRSAGVDLDGAHELPSGSNYAAYDYKGVRYLFLSRRNNGGDGAFTLRLTGEFQVHDLLNGKPLGRMNQIHGTIEPTGVRMYGLYRQPPAPLAVEVQREGRFLKVAFGQTEMPGMLFRIRVFRDGRELHRLSRTVAAEDVVEIDPGLEPSGEWKIEVCRVADRQTRAKSFHYGSK